VTHGYHGSESTRFRGSRKHVLDLLEDKSYIRKINAILPSSAYGSATVSHSDKHQPRGYADHREFEIEEFIRQNCSQWLDPNTLANWWLPLQRKTPQGASWDLISTCIIDSQPGLLLVEAKAHERELSRGGKTKPSATEQSQLNDRQIRKRLDDVTKALRAGKWAVDVNAESHYQLANRIAWAWKLAELGVPTILLYLGFLGDRYFRDYLRDRDHWQRVMGAYLEGVAPLSLPETLIRGKNAGSFTFLIRTLLV
jgi:hypothetical protein